MYPLNVIKYSVTNKTEVVSHTATVQQLQLNAANMTMGKRVYFADHCMCVRTYGDISKILMKFYIMVILNNNKKANHLICTGNTEN